MEITLIALTFSVLIYFFVFRKIENDLDIMSNSITPARFFDQHLHFKGFIVFIEEPILLGDFTFYRKIFSILGEESKYLIVKINFEKEEEEINAKLMNYFGIDSITSVYYHNESKNEKIYDFFSTGNQTFKSIYRDFQTTLKTIGGRV